MPDARELSLVFTKEGALVDDEVMPAFVECLNAAASDGKLLSQLCRGEELQLRIGMDGRAVSEAVMQQVNRLARNPCRMTHP